MESDDRLKLVIIEGAQGAGKSTLSNKLRDTVKYSTMLKLCGLPPIEDQKYEITRYHQEVLMMIGTLSELPITIILDRSFISEYVYANLYKDYDYTNEVLDFSIFLQEMEIPTLYVLLTSDKEEYERRLERPGKAEYQNIAYKAGESIKQQEVYKAIMKKLDRNYLELTSQQTLDEQIEKIKSWLDS